MLSYQALRAESTGSMRPRIFVRFAQLPTGVHAAPSDNRSLRER